MSRTLSLLLSTSSLIAQIISGNFVGAYNDSTNFE